MFSFRKLFPHPKPEENQELGRSRNEMEEEHWTWFSLTSVTRPKELTKRQDLHFNTTKSTSSTFSVVGWWNTYLAAHEAKLEMSVFCYMFYNQSSVIFLVESDFFFFYDSTCCCFDEKMIRRTKRKKKSWKLNNLFSRKLRTIQRKFSQAQEIWFGGKQEAAGISAHCCYCKRRILWPHR